MIVFVSCIQQNDESEARCIFSLDTPQCPNVGRLRDNPRYRSGGRRALSRYPFYRRYMAGWFDYHLRDDARYAPWVFAVAGEAVEEDRMDGRIAWQETADSSAAWRFIHFGSEADNPAIAGDLADPDEDGFPNLLEYALNTDPKNPASRPEVSLGLAKVNGRNHLTLTFARISRAPDLVYRIQASDNLWQWHSLREFLPGEDPPDQDGVRIEGKGLQQITVTDNSPLADQNPRFLRLQVVRQPQPDT